MPESGTATTEPVEQPAAMAEAAAHGAAGEHAAHSGGHRFNFVELNQSHAYPYPAIAWGHGKPQLILNLPGYAAHSFAHLSEDPAFATVVAKGEHVAWAQDYAAAHAGGHCPPAPELAKAMTLADSSSLLGSFPRFLAFFNQQTFWSTVALSLLALVLLVTHRRKPGQYKPEGRIQHMLEVLVLFVRDEIVRPNFHHSPGHGAAWVPMFGGLFLALLMCNLFGLVPIFATATGGIGVTAAWAAITAALMLGMGMKKNGVLGFWASIVPVPWAWKPGTMALWIFLFVNELISLVSRPCVLAVRLFANMFAGHIALLVFASLGFIIFASHPDSTGMVGGLGLFGWVMAFALYALELLVALIQAYIFTLLSAVFIGLCMHPEH